MLNRWTRAFASPAPRLAAVLALLALVAWYAATLGSGFVLTSGDDFSYASAAIDLDQGGASLVHRFDSLALSEHYVPILGQPGAYASKYPLGLSLLLVPFHRLAGYRGLFALTPLMAVLGVAAAYALVWQVTRRRAVALIAAALVATQPLLVFNAGAIGSDVTSMALGALAMAVYVRHVRRPSAPAFWLFSLLAGANFLVRNPNALLFAAVGLHQVACHRQRARAQAAAWLGGALIFGAFLAAQLAGNLLVFGALVGGYAQEAGAQGGLSLASVPHHLPRYLAMLCVAPPLGLVAMVGTIRRRRADDSGLHVLFAGIVLAFVLLYSAWKAFLFDYQHAFVAGARFLLPVLPLMCLFVAVAAQDALPQTRWRAAALAAILGVQLVASAALTRQLVSFKQRMAAHRDRVQAATEPHALLVGPAEWRKLFFPRAGSLRPQPYASYENALRVSSSGGELVRLIEAALRANEPVYALGAGRRQTAAERGAEAVLRAHFRVVTIVDDHAPYDLRVDRVLPR